MIRDGWWAKGMEEGELRDEPTFVEIEPEKYRDPGDCFFFTVPFSLSKREREEEYEQRRERNVAVAGKFIGSEVVSCEADLPCDWPLFFFFTDDIITVY